MISTIRNKWLRRAALCAYVPLYVVLMAILALIASVAEAAAAAWYGWRECTDGMFRVVRDVW